MSTWAVGTGMQRGTTEPPYLPAYHWSLAFWDPLFPNGEGLFIPCPTQEKLHSDYSSSTTSQASKDPLTRQPRHSEGTLTKNKGWAEGRGTRPHPRQVPQLLPPPWLGGQGFRVHPAELPFLPSD